MGSWVDAMKVAELRAMLHKENLDTSGLKKDLVHRLKHHLAQNNLTQPTAAPLLKLDPLSADAEPQAQQPTEPTAPSDAPAVAAVPEATPPETMEPAATVAEPPVAEPPVAEPPAPPPPTQGEIPATASDSPSDAAAATPEAIPAAEAARGAATEAGGGAPAEVPAAGGTGESADGVGEAGIESLRAEAEALRQKHTELTTLCAQWYQAVAALQAAQQPAVAAYGYGQPAGSAYLAGGYPGAHVASRPDAAWAEHYTPEGQLYYFNATTGQSSWEKPANFGAKRGGGKTKGPPGANLFIACRGQGPPLSDEQLRQAFSQFGELVRCEMSLDRATGQPKGFGFVSYSTPEIADVAMAQMNGQLIGDRAIRIEKTST